MSVWIELAPDDPVPPHASYVTCRVYRYNPSNESSLNRGAQPIWCVRVPDT